VWKPDVTDTPASDPNEITLGTTHHRPTIFSILIGRVSTEDSARILETLDALRAQKGSPTYEVIIADRRCDAITDLVGVDYPEAQVIRCATGTSLPELRALALVRACGHYVVVTEDHCIPPEDWLANILEAFSVAPELTVAVGGTIENGICDTALDWATFLCEYTTFVRPIRCGPARSLPGMNVAYLRSAIIAIDRAVLLQGFWETTVHPIFAQKGLLLYLSNSVMILHKKRFSFAFFAHQRFLYSRYHASLRFTRNQVAARWGMCALTFGLPPLLLFRIARSLFMKKRLLPQFIRAFPYLALFLMIWAWGEMVGYIFGPGDALLRIE
jgi:Glycosyl transferase family 2